MPYGGRRSPKTSAVRSGAWRAPFSRMIDRLSIATLPLECGSRIPWRMGADLYERADLRAGRLAGLMIVGDTVVVNAVVEPAMRPCAQGARHRCPRSLDDE